MKRVSRRAAVLGPVAIAAGLALRSSALAALQEMGTPVAAPVLPATVTGMDGSEIVIEDISRIVPLSGDIAEIIWDLGLGANIVAVDFSAVYPEELLALPKIGVERNLNAEGILSMNPTVVIGKDAAGPPPVLEQVSGAGVPVFIMVEPQTIEAPIVKIQETAKALGVVAEGDALATTVQAEIDAASALAATSSIVPTAIVLYLQEGGIQLVAGGGTVASAMLTAAGARDAALETGIMGYQPLTAESLVAAAPDIIVTQTLGVEAIGGLESVKNIPGVAETPAGKNDQVFVYDDELLLGMTPRTGQQLMQMVLDFHPDVAAAPEATPAG